MHFEDFWNGAEQLGARFTDDTVEKAVDRIHQAVDKLEEMASLPAKQAEIIGEVIFDLCQITRHLNINSAAALRWAVENRKARLLDPEDENRQEGPINNATQRFVDPFDASGGQPSSS